MGRPDISAHGICLAETEADAQPADPAQDCVNLDARSTTGTFAIDFGGLTSGATYHYSAWAQNSAGLDFGETRTARVWAAPAVDTLRPQDVSQTGARLRGEVTDLGFPAATAWGFCYDTEADFSSEECDVLTSTPALSTFQRTITGRDSGTTYYVRAWVENSTGREYGETLPFRTLQLPVVVTDPAQDVERESATLAGTLNSLGNPEATEHGFCWGTMPEPSLDNDATCELLGTPAGTGPFTADLTELNQGTTYTFRALAINALQPVYGSARTFRTERDAEVVTLVPDDRGPDTLRFRGRIDLEPIPDRNAQGFCWSSTSATPDESDTCIAVPDVDSSGVFSFVPSGLAPDATYRVRAWVDNSARRTWGNVAQEQTCSLDDQPDGVDRNCDGVDGNVTRSIFVNRVLGSDTGGCGLLPAAPCATIQQGVDRAASLPGRTDVLVTIADYDETVTLASGVNLYGGYLPATWMRDAASRTGIRPAGPVALIVDGYATAGVVEGFIIRSSDGNASAPTSRALVLRDVSGALRFRNNEIRAGLGFPGAQGADGSEGAGGQTGEPGTNGRFQDDAPGGAGGTSTCGAAGGAGGLGRNNNSGLAGASGAGTLGGAGGEGRSRACLLCLESAGSGGTGDPGGNGASGANAGTVANQARGDILGLDWRGRAGQAGTAGSPGGGGGGGGAGGGLCAADAGIYSCGSHSGGGGGGGGAGGCGGGGGAGGGGGGGSVAVLAINASAAIFEGNIIRTDGAGNGGAGGVGAEGGEGAGGQNGGFESQRDVANFSSGSGGAGGAGGDGGIGGSGGGGAGGTSAGFLLHNSAGLQQSGSTFTIGSAGAGGAGGSGLLGTAPSGESGRSGNVLTW